MVVLILVVVVWLVAKIASRRFYAAKNYEKLWMPLRAGLICSLAVTLYFGVLVFSPDHVFINRILHGIIAFIWGYDAWSGYKFLLTAKAEAAAAPQNRQN